MGFLENNPYLWNKTYDNVGIYQRCYIANAEVIICSENKVTVNAIKDELIGLGYIDMNIKEGEKQDIFEVVGEIKVEELEELYPKSDGASKAYVENVMKLQKLKKFEVDTNTISYEDLYGLNRKEIYNNRIFLKQFEVIVTNKCSLKCKKCAAGIQYFRDPSQLKENSIVCDYNRVLELIDWVDRVVIMGGEPFLYKDLDKVLDGIYKNANTLKKVGGVKIITNGTIVPSQNVLDSISKSDTVVWISDYGEKSRKIGELIEVFQKNRINYTVLNVQEWSDVIQLNDNCRIQSENELKNRRKHDCVTRCRTVANGKFYLCSLLKSMDYLGITPFAKTNYVDIYDENARKQIIDMLDMDQPLPQACSFCTGCSEEKWNEGGLVSAEQINKSLPYVKNRI